jgi:hypothetical protein
MACVAAAAGNGGRIFRPQIVKEIQSSDGTLVKVAEAELTGTWPVKVENLNITEPKSLKWYKSTTDETPNVHRGFCSECGSSLFWHPKDQPNIAIAAGSLDSPTNLKTIGHIWCSQKTDYYKIEDHLPQFDERWSA